MIGKERRDSFNAAKKRLRARQKAKTLEPDWPQVVMPGVYRHYAGKLYFVFMTARHRETGEALVIYMPLYAHQNGGHVPQACPIGMWFDTIEPKRFSKWKIPPVVTRFTWIGHTLPKGIKEVEKQR
jgi:hypothetical protein